jgi:hypothetical protein
MMDLTAERHLRCDRIRDLDVARQPATVRRAVEILQAERSALTVVTRCSTKPRRSRSDRHHTVTAGDDGFGSYVYHCESHRGSRGEVIVT